MKKIIFAFFLISLIFSGLAFSDDYQVASIYICSTDKYYANLTAMARISRKELYTVSYCNCDGADWSLRKEVKYNKEKEEDPCKSTKNDFKMVYFCSCVGKANY